MDLALDYLERLICHKTQKSNQPTNQPTTIMYDFLPELINFFNVLTSLSITIIMIDFLPELIKKVI